MCHTEVHLNHVFGIHLQRKMPTVWDNLLAFPDTSNPSKVLWDSFFQDMFVAPWPQGTAVLRSSHQLRLLPYLQSQEFFCCSQMTLLAQKLLVLAFGELWKWNYSVSYTGLVVLVCKPCTSVLEEFSWKNSFSLLSCSYYFIFFLLESNYCFFTEAGLPVVLSITAGENCNKFHHLVVQHLGKG